MKIHSPEVKPPGLVAVGLGIRHWHRPVGVGLLLAAGTALIFLLGMAIPATRNAFFDSRAARSSVWTMLYQVLIRVKDVLGGDQLVATLLAVASMTLTGVLLCALARLGKGIKTTMLVHWATNSLGFVAAWLVMR